MVAMVTFQSEIKENDKVWPWYKFSSIKYAFIKYQHKYFEK